MTEFGFANRFVRVGCQLAAVAVCLVLTAGTAAAQQRYQAGSIPRNISPGLRHLLKHLQAGEAINLSHEGFVMDMKTGQMAHQTLGAPMLIYDSSNRVLVNVHLNGRTAIEQLRQQLEQAGSRVTAQNPSFHRGVIEAYVPLTSVAQAAQLPGTSHIQLVYRPYANVGATTSQGATVMRSDVANSLGYDGTGVTVGILSDSYNTSQFYNQPPFPPGTITTNTALDDVNTGDLPNNTSIPGCEGLKFCADLDPTAFGPGTDEGRGMAQIVHDVAPGAQLCFGTAFAGEVQFAVNILTLALNWQCGADVLVDDVIYFDEPMFSDGLLAQAVDIVNANGVSYFSSAGNQAFSGYDSPLRIVPNSVARSLHNQAVDLSTIPAVDPNDGLPIDTTGGFHNFNPGFGPPVLSQLITSSNPVFSFQWDDPFDFVDADGNPLVTTDLDLLFFDPDSGQFLFSVNTDNFALDEPIELFGLNGTGSLRLVISRKGTNTVTGQPAANQATHIKYVIFGSANGDYFTPLTPLTFGHDSAAGANGVAAYRYNISPGFPWNVPGTRAGQTRPELEYFSSPGPAVIYIDENGNRLKHPDLRPQPVIAAPDGVNTTFFPQPELGGSDFEALYGVPDGFPNFFGTSAAAPHAAAVAALLLQKAGGPGSLSPSSVTQILTSSAPPRDVNAFKSVGDAGDFLDTVSIEARDPEFLSLCAPPDCAAPNGGQDANYFTVSFWSANRKVSLQSITLDLTNSGQAFRPSTFPVTQGTSSPGVSIASSSPTTLSQALTVNFSGFSSGQLLRFGVYRVFVRNGVAVGTGGKAGDITGGDTFTATLSTGKVLHGTFRNLFGTQYRTYDGFGLIDAVSALNQVGSHHHH